MEETTFKAIKKKDTSIFATIFVIAITGIITFFVLFFTKDNLSSDMKTFAKSMYYILGVSLVLAAISIWYYIKKQFTIVVNSQQTAAYVEVKDPDLGAPLLISSPFTIRKQWQHVVVGGGRTPKMKCIYVTLVDPRDIPLITFYTELGALHEAPIGYDYIDFLNAESRAKLILADKQYGVRKLERLGLSLTWAIRKLEPKK